MNMGSWILLGVILCALLTWLVATYMRVWRKPLVRCTATVREKRTVSSFADTDGVACFVTFSFEGDDQEELAVHQELYSEMRVGQVGPLTRRGTRVLRFEPQSQAEPLKNTQR